MADQLDGVHTEKKNRRSGWLIGCAVGTVVTLCVVTFLIIGGFAGLVALMGGEPEGLNVEVTAPSSPVTIAEVFQITVTLSNETSQNITVDEIKLPNELLANVLVTNIDPEETQVTVTGEQTAYVYDRVIAPTGIETFVFNFEAVSPAEVSGNIEVVTSAKTTTSEIRVVISSAAAQDDDGESVSDDIMAEVIPYRSVVQIIAVVEMDGGLVQGWTGSGTIISDDGLILTNAHVILSDRYYEVVDLVVSITEEQDRPPVPMFYADVIQADEPLDLAVIKVRSTLDGGPANFSALGIDPVPLGNSESLRLGDPIVIIGYPGIGGETITLTRGEVSGFTSEAGYGNRAFIKTSATIAGGNSGGLASTPQGEIIGIPTQVGSGNIENMIVDCRALADTNRDGVIDQGDNCVPTGGFINALRPVRLALPLIDAAVAGEISIITNADRETHEEYDPAGDVIFSDSFDDNDNGWGTLNDAEGSVSVTGGQLVIDVYTDNMIFWSTLPDVYESLIMVAEANVLQPAGDGDIGFVCGYQDENNFTALEISEDGYYSIWKYESGDFITLVEWTPSDVVASDGPFTLAAYCGPDRLALAVNDTLLAETFDPSYSAGQVGLLAGCWELPNISVGFEDFIILAP